jgi:DNA-binding transcriptional regulator YhcF (GntR family)
MPGWFLIHRDLCDSDEWTAERFTRAQAWIDLIYLARWQPKPNTFRHRGIQVTEQRGQVAIGMRNLAERWGWARNTVKHFLSDLQNDGRIDRQKNNVISLITIKNYEKYQVTDQQIDQQTDPQVDHQIDPLLKKDKESKEVKEKEKDYCSPSGELVYPEDFLSFWKVYPLKVGKGAAHKAWKKLKPGKQVQDDIQDALNWQRSSDKWKEDNGKYIPHASTYLNQRRWEDEQPKATNSENYAEQARESRLI